MCFVVDVLQDTFSVTSITFSLLFSLGYAINVTTELGRIFKSTNKKFSDLPLTIDCPIFIAGNMLAFIICFLLPYIVGKPYFNCTNDGSVLVTKVPEQNWSCGIQGWINVISIHGTFWYMSLLSFSVFRYVKNPERPLFGIHKFWYHCFVWSIVLSLFIGTLIVDMYTNLPPLGLCGPKFILKTEAKLFIIYPMITCTCIFGIFTPCSIYYTLKHLRHESKMGSAPAIVRDLAHLSIRLIIYQFFVAVGGIIFIVVAELSMRKFEGTLDSYQLYLECLFNTGEDANVFGDICSIGPILPNIIYYVQGVVSLLVTSATFALSCSIRRMEAWQEKKKQVSDFIGSQIHSVNETVKQTASTNSKQLKKLSKKLGGINNTNITSETNTPVVPRLGFVASFDSIGSTGSITPVGSVDIAQQPATTTFPQLQPITSFSNTSLHVTTPSQDDNNGNDSVEDKL